MSRILQAVALSALNQAVSSGTHFMLSALLVRQLSQEGFGAYGLAFSALLLALNIGDALFMTPMTVAIAQTPPNRVSAYASTVFLGATAVTGVMSIPIGVAAALMFRSAGAGHLLGLSTAVAVAAFSLVLKDCLVRICYAMGREATALAINGAFAVVVLGLVLAPMTRAATPMSAVVYYALAAGLAATGGFLILGLFRRVRGSHPLAEMKRLFQDGRWYLGSNFTYWLRLQAPILVAGWTLGLTVVGMLNAARILVTPPVLLNPALSQVALPRLSTFAHAESDPRYLRRALALVGAVLVGATTIYCLFLWNWFEAISRLLLGPARGVSGAVVGSWCVFVVAQALRNAAELGLKARRLARINLAANAVSAVLTFPACILGALAVGDRGIVLGAAFGELCVVAAGALALARTRRLEASPHMQRQA